jgi:hypothetical protein
MSFPCFLVYFDSGTSTICRCLVPRKFPVKRLGCLQPTACVRITPFRQKPNWAAPSSMNACCRGWAFLAHRVPLARGDLVLSNQANASKAELVRQHIEQMCWRIHFDRVYLAVYFERNGCQQFDRQRRLKPLSILDAADLAGVVGRVGHIIEGEDVGTVRLHHPSVARVHALRSFFRGSVTSRGVVCTTIRSSYHPNKRLNSRGVD